MPCVARSRAALVSTALHMLGNVALSGVESICVKFGSTVCSPARAAGADRRGADAALTPRPTRSNRRRRCRLRSTAARRCRRERRCRCPRRRAPAQRAAEPLPPPAQPRRPQRSAADAGGFDIKGALDKMFAASDAQIGEKLRAIVAAKQLDRRIERAARPQGDRGLLRRAQLRAAVDPRRRAHRARQGGDRAAARTPPPTGSTPPTIRCRISPPSPAPSSWPTATSRSPIRCSPSPAICRAAASRRRACSRRSITATTRRSRPTSCKQDRRRRATSTPRSTASIRRTKASGAQGQARRAARQCQRQRRADEPHPRRRADQAGRQGRARAGAARAARPARQGRTTLAYDRALYNAVRALQHRHDMQADRHHRRQDHRR